MTIDRAIVIALALVCAVLSVALNTEKHGRIVTLPPGAVLHNG